MVTRFLAMLVLGGCTNNPFELQLGFAASSGTPPLDRVVVDGSDVPPFTRTFSSYDEAAGVDLSIEVTRAGVLGSTVWGIGRCGGHDIGDVTYEYAHVVIEEITADGSLEIDYFRSWETCVGTDGSFENGSD